MKKALLILLLAATSCKTGYNKQVVKAYHKAIKSEMQLHFVTMPERKKIVQPTIDQFEDYMEAAK